MKLSLEFVRALASLAVAMLLPAGVVHATTLNIDFGSANGAPSSTFGAASGQTGVWNNVNAFGSTAGLVDSAGNAGGLSVSVTSAGFSSMAGAACTSSSNDFQLMMCDNFYSSGTWGVSLSGLSDGIYDLYLYDGLNTAVSLGAGTANGVVFGSVNGAFSGTAFDNSNYVVAGGVVVSGGQLNITATGASLIGLAGLQVVPFQVPEPGSMVLVASALTGAALARWSRRRTSPVEARPFVLSVPPR